MYQPERNEGTPNKKHMPSFKFKKWQYIVIFAVIILFLLNPSLTKFKEFQGSNKALLAEHNYRRTANFLIFSIYSDYDSGSGNEVKYVGFLNNFIYI
jgi:hypothetical protein